MFFLFFFFFSSLQFSFSNLANTNEYANLNFLDYELRVKSLLLSGIEEFLSEIDRRLYRSVGLEISARTFYFQDEWKSYNTELKVINFLIRLKMNTTNFFCNLFINFFSFQKLKIENVKKKKNSWNVWFLYIFTKNYWFDYAISNFVYRYFWRKNNLGKVEHESIEKIVTGNMFCNAHVHNKHR